MSPSKPIRYRQLGGWDLDKVKDPRKLFKVTIKTSIECWEEWVLARDRAELDQWLAIKHPSGCCPGYEPSIELMNGGMDSIWMTL